jgi:hypothetical protein
MLKTMPLPCPSGGLDQPVSQAHEEFLRLLTVPVLINREDGPVILGTGTLFEIETKIFLVTAKHIFDDEDCAKVAIPASPNDRTIAYLNDHKRYVPNDGDARELDICAIELRHAPLVDYVRGHWTCLTLDDTTTPASEGRFIVCGYPSALSSHKANGLDIDVVTKILAFYTNRIPAPPNAEPPVDDAIDIFLRHGSVNRSVDGEPTSSPRFHGVSGASIWQTLPKSGGFWTPRSTLKVAGIQNANRYGEYLRATSWDSVGVLLRQAAAS